MISYSCSFGMFSVLAARFTQLVVDEEAGGSESHSDAAAWTARSHASRCQIVQMLKCMPCVRWASHWKERSHCPHGPHLNPNWQMPHYFAVGSRDEFQNFKYS